MRRISARYSDPEGMLQGLEHAHSWCFDELWVSS